MIQQTLTIKTLGRGMVNITSSVEEFVHQSKVQMGVCHLFLHHTSASLILCENADSTVKSDLEAFIKRLVPDGDPLFKHTAEGPDDMPSHIRSILTQNDLTIPITQSDLRLGTWQGIYLWEHRLKGHERNITMTILS